MGKTNIQYPRTNDLFICGPTVDLGADTEHFVNYAYKTLRICLQKDRFVALLPAWNDDTYRGLIALGKKEKRVLNPFDDIFQIMYQVSMRTVGANDIAEDRKLLLSTLDLFDRFENSMSPTRLIFPWLPTPNFIYRLYVAGRLGMLISGIVRKRKRNGIKINDPLQAMIDQGDSTIMIISVLRSPVLRHSSLFQKGKNVVHVTHVLLCPWAS